MKDLLSIAGFTKQGFWKHNQCEGKKLALTEQIIGIIKEKRKNHKRMGCRSIYYACSEPMPVGRDTFERIGFANGFKLRKKPNLVKTTWGQKTIIYPNLIEGKTLTGINQVWQSDIFYISVEGKNYYGFTIEDVYSRRVLALHIARSLKAQELAKALQQAINERKGYDLRKCIFHSDRGTQYISNDVAKLLDKYKIRPSMCKLPQENSYVERVQGTIKHHYLYEVELREKNLPFQTRKILNYYNFEKPHLELSHYPPGIFERIVEKTPIAKRPKEHIFKWIDPLSTNNMVFNKKEKRSKKEKIIYNRSLLYS